MSLRMRVHDREPIGAALRRFKKLLERSGLVKELRSSQAAINERVKQLSGNGFLANEDGKFRYSPASPENAAAVHDLALAYPEYRVRIIELIYSRAGALESFSTAFKFKPKN